MSEEVTKTINNPMTKRLVMDILFNSDSVDVQGKRQPRVSIPKELFRGYRVLKDNLISSLEYGIAPVSNNPLGYDIDKIEWVPMANIGDKIPADKKVVAERYTDTEVEVRKESLKALRYFYNERTDLVDSPIEALDELESLLSIS